MSRLLGLGAGLAITVAGTAAGSGGVAGAAPVARTGPAATVPTTAAPGVPVWKLADPTAPGEGRIVVDATSCVSASFCLAVGTVGSAPAQGGGAEVFDGRS